MGSQRDRKRDINRFPMQFSALHSNEVIHSQQVRSLPMTILCLLCDTLIENIYPLLIF